MLSIEEKHLKIVLNILKKYPYEFYAFGSRVKGNAKRISDLDLCFFEPISLNVLSHLDEDFDESDLPFKVDVINGLSCSKEFLYCIQEDLVKLSP